MFLSKKKASGGHFYIRHYNYDLLYLADRVAYGPFKNVMDGIYFGSASLKDSYVAFIFFTDINDGTSLRIIVGNATKNGKSYKYPSKLEYYLNETEINFNTGISMNDFLKIDEKN